MTFGRDPRRVIIIFLRSKKILVTTKALLNEWCVWVIKEEGSYFVVRWCPRKKYVIYYLEKTPSFLRTPTKNPFLQAWWHWVTSFPIFFFSKGNWILSPNWWSISTHPALAKFWSLESLSSAERSVTFYLISHVSLLMGVGIGMLSIEF